MKNIIVLILITWFTIYYNAFGGPTQKITGNRMEFSDRYVEIHTVDETGWKVGGSTWIPWYRIIKIVESEIPK